MDKTVGIIGSGAAGMMAAISAAQHCRVTLITDRTLGKSNTVMAQGGLQCPFTTPASVESFQADMRQSARVPLDSDLNALFTGEARQTILDLAAWGVPFDTDEQGQWRRRTAGGLSEPRLVTAGDRIGVVLMKVLRQTLAKQGVEVLESSPVTGIEKQHAGFSLQLSGQHAGTRSFDSLVVCTGGLAFQRAQSLGQWTTNPPNENGLMYDLLRKAGLQEVHQDYFQYQPFGILAGDSASFGKAIPESILTQPISILDRHGRMILERGERPDRLTLCERMFAREAEGAGIEAGNGDLGFRLLLEDVPAGVLEQSYPSTMAFLSKHGLARSSILIRPFLHYFLGGFKIDARCQSTLPGLFLAGEITGGIHGRNRLMGNGLTDALVHGRRAGLSAADHARGAD